MTYARVALGALSAALLAGLALCATTGTGAAASIITFDPPNGSGSIASVSAINQEGTVVGYYVDASGNSHGFVRTSDGTFTTIDGPNASNTGIGGVNDSGTIVGTFENASGEGPDCFVKKMDGKLRVFGIPKSLGCSATSINKYDVIAGWYSGGAGNFGFVRDKGTVAKIELADSYPAQINDAGVATGWYIESSKDVRGFVRAADGTLTTFDAPNAQRTEPTSINATGEVVGWYWTKKSVQRAFIRAADGTFTTFRYGVAALADAINKSGQVAGFHMNKNGANVGYIRSSDGSTVRDFQAGVSTFLDVMNNDGTTAGTYEDSNSVYHGFVRTR